MPLKIKSRMLRKRFHAPLNSIAFVIREKQYSCCSSAATLKRVKFDDCPSITNDMKRKLGCGEGEPLVYEEERRHNRR